MLSGGYLIWFWGILLSRQTLHAQHGVHFVADNVSTTCCVLCSRRPLHNTLCTLYHTSSPQHVRFRSDVAHWKLSTLLANHGVIVGQPWCHCWPTMVSLLANSKKWAGNVMQKTFLVHSAPSATLSVSCLHKCRLISTQFSQKFCVAELRVYRRLFYTYLEKRSCFRALFTFLSQRSPEIKNLFQALYNLFVV